MSDMPATPAGFSARPQAPHDGWPVICAALLAAILIIANARAILGDPDTQWHAVVGSQILADWAFPQIDQLSHTHAGEPWIAKEWLAQVALTLAERVGGWNGILSLTAVAIVGSYLAVSGPALRAFPPLYAFAFIVMCVMIGSSGFLARPHALSLPMFALFAASLSRTIESGNEPPWLLVPLLALWANTHGFFVLGVAMAAIVGLHLLINAEPAERPRVMARWSVFGALLLVAGCMTPYGAEPLLLTFSFGGSEPRDFITEWAAPELSIATVSGGLLLVGALSGCGLNPRRRFAHLIILGWFGYMMLSYSRFALQFSIVAAAFAVFPIADLVRRFAPGLPRTWLPSARPAYAATALVLMLTAAVASLLPAEPPARVRPTQALEAARAAGLRGPVYNSYDLGGALIRAGVPTFVDGRTDQLFRDGFRAMIQSSISAPTPGPLAAMIHRHGVRWAIVHSGGEEDRKFEVLGWRLVHRDADASVYAAPDAINSPV